MDSTSSSSTSFSTISTLMHEASCMDSMSARYRAYMPPDKDIDVNVKKCYVNGTDNLFGNHLNQKLLKQANGLNYKLIKGESQLNWAQEIIQDIILTERKYQNSSRTVAQEQVAIFEVSVVLIMLKLNTVISLKQYCLEIK
uniref:Uncharacterized protein n=1 Tax=Panagrolaimus superbus TaxID=310955 RepID=A0A914YLD6_9BILA